jgi:hypothetical protein
MFVAHLQFRALGWLKFLLVSICYMNEPGHFPNQGEKRPLHLHRDMCANVGKAQERLIVFNPLTGKQKELPYLFKHCNPAPSCTWLLMLRRNLTRSLSPAARGAPSSSPSTQLPSSFTWLCTPRRNTTRSSSPEAQAKVSLRRASLKGDSKSMIPELSFGR